MSTSVAASSSFSSGGRVTPKGVQSLGKRGEVFAGSWLFSEKRALFWLSLVSELYGTDCAVKTAQLLLKRYFRHGGKVYGAQLKMAEILRVHPNTICNHVRRLKDAGLITVTDSPPVRDKASGLWCRRETNRYWLRFPCAAQATNRRVARRRSLLGVVAVPEGTVLSEEAVALLNSPIAQEIMAEIDGKDSVVPGLTYTQPNGSESFTGTKETSPYVVTVPGVVEKQVIPPKIEPEGTVSAAEAFALMRAQLKRVGR